MPTNQSHDGRYPLTRWSLIFESQGDDEVAQRALNELLSDYWYPIYSQFRDWSQNKQDAEDLTQGFMASMLARRDISKVDSERGSFRSYLRTAIKNYRNNDWDFQTAQKRGGGVKIVSIDVDHAELRYAEEPHVEEDPALLFDRRWINTVLENSERDLRHEWMESGKSDEFELLKGFLVPNQRSRPFSEIAEETGLKQGTIRAKACRMRDRYREIIRDHFFQTVNGAKRVELELGHLAGLVGLDLDEKEE